MQEYYAPNWWYELDETPVYPKRMTDREMELEEEIAQLSDSFKEMIDLMADKKDIRLSEFHEVIKNVAQKLNFNVERDTVFKIWDRML
jgi:GTP cyclohydrolase FolE2